VNLYRQTEAPLGALTEQPPPERLRALLAEAWERKSDVLVPALVCAECCRGAGRTRAVESALAQHRETRAARPAVRVVPTDFDLARRVGSVLHGAGADTADTKDIVDAHSVAVASTHGRAVVVTAHPDDILRLASAMPAVRIVTRPAR
jgi:predicted nucleic acid-binding protein